MGNYVNSNLIPGEVVRYEAMLHWSFWITPTVITLFIAVFFSAPAQASSGNNMVFPIAVCFYGCIVFGIYYLKWISFEFVITNKRVIYKTGVIRRTSFEQMLNKVDSLSVDQGIFDRLFGRGTICIHTTGTTKNVRRIADPQEFRSEFYVAVDEVAR